MEVDSFSRGSFFTPEFHSFHKRQSSKSCSKTEACVSAGKDIPNDVLKGSWVAGSSSVGCLDSKSPCLFSLDNSKSSIKPETLEDACKK